jgi:hypothetical protein
MGWTTAPIEGTSDQAPVLYKQVGDFPAVTADVTYYAVFAHGEQGADVTPVVYTYDADHQDGWTNTASMSGSYWLLDKGKILTSPEVNLAGLSSIEVNIRTYGGTSYCNLDVKAGETQIATIVATNGKTLTDYTWTNTQPLSGTSPLTFSTNYNTNQGIGFTRVVINATGSGVTYSQFITSCGTTGLEKTNQQPIANSQKLLINGQLYIQVGDQIFTVTGQRIR